jgi:hypothetical protein
MLYTATTMATVTATVVCAGCNGGINCYRDHPSVCPSAALRNVMGYPAMCYVCDALPCVCSSTQMVAAAADTASDSVSQ